MAIRVPINPQTRVPQGQLGYEKAVDVTAGTRALGAVIREYGEEYNREQKKRELFDVQKLLVEETNNLELDFDEKKQVEKLGAPAFTQRIAGQYNTRHQEMIKNLRSQGYSDDAVNEFETRLGTIRSQYVAKAIEFQDKSQYAKVNIDFKNAVTSLSQYSQNNPNAVQSALDEAKVMLQNSGLDELEQAIMYEKNAAPEILKGAREGYAIQHPEVVLGLYGFPNELKQEQNLATGELVNLGTAQQTVANELTNAGMNPNVVAGFLGNFHVEGGYTGKKGDGGSAAGIAQLRGERRENFKKMFGKDPSEATIAENAKFTVWEMQNPKKAGMTVAQRDKILAASSPEQAAELIDKFYERSSGKARSQRVEAAKLFVSTMAHADQTEAVLTQAPTVANDQGKTGVPILDLSSGPERFQMLDTARRVMNEREADVKAQKQAEHSAYINDFYNGLQDSKLGQSDLNAAYREGRITDYDERKKAQGIIDSKIKKQTDLQRFGAMLDANQKFNPYDDKTQKAVDAGFDKAVELTNAPGGEKASPFLIALDIWNKTGVLPKQGGVMIRGGLISTDPATVAASASVASNMLDANPNAFASVEGGEDIGKAAATYAHYVDDLGMTAQEAAQKIALQNSPEFQAKRQADQPEREKFVKAVNDNNIENTLNKALGTDIGRLTNFITFGAFDTRGRFNTPQKAEAKQTFLELSLDHYDKYHDPEAATAYASKQMARFYGVENGRFLKFPASKSYPEVQGSREYIFDQAKKYVDEFAGQDVAKEDIWLQPTTNGSTAAAFRAGRPAPYELHFITRDTGQAVYHYIPGKAFVADVGEAQRAAAIEARKREQQIRSQRKVQSLPQFGG